MCDWGGNGSKVYFLTPPDLIRESAPKRGGGVKKYTFDACNIYGRQVLSL